MDIINEEPVVITNDFQFKEIHSNAPYESQKIMNDVSRMKIWRIKNKIF
jgi:hypothetical protein